MASPSTTFSQTVACKLDEKNYMNWHQQVNAVLRAHQLEKYVVNPVVPLKYLSEEDRAAGTINPEFTNWDRQDALIMSWLLSTLSDSILSRVVTCCHSFQVWNAICSHFHGLTRARTMQLRLELRTIKKGNKSCSEYLQRILQLCDTLTATGDAISNCEQTDAILGGLPPEYEALISTITAFLTRDADVSVLDIETMILAHEARLEQHKQTALQEPLTLNLAESTSAPHIVPANIPENHVVANYVSAQGAATANSMLFSSNPNQYSSQGNFPANGSGYGRRQNCGRGAQGRGGQVQCQICKKRGHEASTCYHRSAVAPFGNFGSPYSLVSTTFSFNTVLHHPTLVLRNFLATCSNHTLLMAPLPLPGCHTYLIHIFRTQRLLLVINPLSHPIMAPPSSSSKFHLLLTFPRLGFQIQVVHTMQPMIHINSFRAVKLQEMNIS